MRPSSSSSHTMRHLMCLALLLLQVGLGTTLRVKICVKSASVADEDIMIIDGVIGGDSDTYFKIVRSRLLIASRDAGCIMCDARRACVPASFW